MIFLRNSVLQVFLLINCCVALMLTITSIAYAKKSDPIPTKTEPSLAETHYHSEQESQELPESVTTLLKKYKIPEENLSIYIRDLNAEKPALILNADKMRNPASTMKLLTTYAGLKVLIDAGFDEIVKQSLVAAKQRAYELRNL